MTTIPAGRRPDVISSDWQGAAASDADANLQRHVQLGSPSGATQRTDAHAWAATRPAALDAPDQEATAADGGDVLDRLVLRNLDLRPTNPLRVSKD